MYKSPNVKFEIGEQIGCYWPGFYWVIGTITEMGGFVFTITVDKYYDYKQIDNNYHRDRWDFSRDSHAEFYTPEELKIKLL